MDPILPNVGVSGKPGVVQVFNLIRDRYRTINQTQITA